jgi:DNA-binding PadR family transcriptional regulator
MSILPSAFRVPEILPPAKAPSVFSESTYTALYTFLISLITLSGGSIQEQKLDRYLQRTNTDQYTPVDRTDRLLQRMCKDGYLVRNREMDGGEEVIEYMVGPRGKTEVGESGVSGLVRTVYGKQISSNTSQDDLDDMFEARLARSVRGHYGIAPAEPDNNSNDAPEETDNRRNQSNRRNTRNRGSDDDEDY